MDAQRSAATKLWLWLCVTAQLACLGGCSSLGGLLKVGEKEVGAIEKEIEGRKASDKQDGKAETDAKPLLSKDEIAEIDQLVTLISEWGTNPDAIGSEDKASWPLTYAAWNARSSFVQTIAPLRTYPNEGQPWFDSDEAARLVAGWTYVVDQLDPATVREVWTSNGEVGLAAVWQEIKARADGQASGAGTSGSSGSRGSSAESDAPAFSVDALKDTLALYSLAATKTSSIDLQDRLSDLVAGSIGESSQASELLASALREIQDRSREISQKHAQAGADGSGDGSGKKSDGTSGTSAIEPLLFPGLSDQSSDQ